MASYFFLDTSNYIALYTFHVKKLFYFVREQMTVLKKRNILHNSYNNRKIVK